MMVTDDDVIADEALVQAAQAGCEIAFTSLVERYYNPILAYFTRQTKDAELAADLAQDTFCDAFQHVQQCNLERPFAAWLYCIARNNLLHAWRQARRHSVSLSAIAPADEAAVWLLAASDMASMVHEQQTIYLMLTTLQPALRHPLLLYYWADLSQDHIADVLHISPAAVRQRVKRAKQQVRNWYDTFDVSN